MAGRRFRQRTYCKLKLFKPLCSLDVRKYSFAYRVIDIWNSLSSDIVNASSISVFKHKLEFIDFTPRLLSASRVHLDLCVSLMCYFLLLGMCQCLHDLCVQTYV